MKNKIISITEKVPQIITLPDGLYTGSWGGYIIEVRFKNKVYELETEEGVRGMNINVVVEIKEGEGTFDTINS
jgi:hypothetical protein